MSGTSIWILKTTWVLVWVHLIAKFLQKDFLQNFCKKIFAEIFAKFLLTLFTDLNTLRTDLTM